MTVLLARPHVRFHASWLASAAEFAAAGDLQHGGRIEWPADETYPGLHLTPEDLVDPAAFAAFVEQRLADELPESPRPRDWSPSTILWMEDPDVPDEYVGGISLRHNLTQWLLEFGGHVGYSVRPSARRRGFASGALGQVVALAGRRGIDRVLVTCDEDNVGSARVIESCGGVLEDVREGKRRYWIPAA